MGKEQQERWLPVAGYEEFYEVSDLGRVRSLDRVCGKMPRGADRHIKGQVLKPTDNGYGYLVVNLKRDGRRVSRYVHRLVAEAFVENPMNYNVVNHIDYNKRNNVETNLEWCTQRHNVMHSLPHYSKQKNVKTNTGERYISLTSNGKFRVKLKKAKFDKSFDTLQEAVVCRNEVLNDIGYTI